MSASLASAIESMIMSGTPAVLVRVENVWGSTPRASGAQMAVSAKGIEGTIGGGQLEWEAIGRARHMIETGEQTAKMDLPLGPALGQCCGGRVTLSLQQVDAALLAELHHAEATERASEPMIAIFGAGHVGKALVGALDRLPYHLLWWDQRKEEFPQEIGPQTTISQADMRDCVASLKPGSAVVVLTHNHKLDYEIVEAALARGDLSYVGMIGSRTKRARLEKWLKVRENNANIADLTCPIGGAGVADKRPEVIAALTTAEIIKSLAKAVASRHDADKADKNKKVGAGR